jgi:PKD repeat protein
MRTIITLLILFISSLAVVAQNYDVALVEIIRPNGYYSVFESVQYPYVVVENVGDQTVTEIDVFYRIDDGEIVSRNVAPIELEPGQTRNVLFMDVDLPIGAHEFTSWVDLPEGIEDANLSNNEMVADFFVTGGDLAVVNIDQPIGDYCGFDSLSPSVWIKNIGDIDVLNFTARYRLDADPLVNYEWEGMLEQGDSVLISFPLFSPGNGEHSLQFFVQNPNSAPDFDNSNNSMGTSFAYYMGQHISIEIQTDWNGHQNTFYLYNSLDEEIASEGPFDDETNYVFDYCLIPGCYKFIIWDSGDNGMCHTQSQGYYKITNEYTDEIIATACNFGTLDEVVFCLPPPEGPPIPFFSYEIINSCSGEVEFNDLSSSATDITSYLWDFGDGTTSTEQNPYHFFNGTGAYNVSLTVGNEYGEETFLNNNSVIIEMPPGPIVNDDFSCGAGDLTLSVDSNGDDINWYPSIDSDESIFSGSDFSIEDLTETTTWYVQEIVAPDIFNIGLPDNSGPGGYFGFNIWRSVHFVAHQDLTIKSIKFFAYNSAERTFYISQDGDVIDSYSINIPEGEHRINVNWQLPEGEYDIFVSPQNNLAYTGDYGGPNVGYPFTQDGLLSITGNNYGDSFFYFFYDMEIFAGFNEYCLSPKVPVTAYVLNPQPELEPITQCCDGQDCILDAGDDFEEYLWNTAETEQFIAAAEGIYTVSVTDSYGCTGEGSTEVIMNEPGNLDFYIDYLLDPMSDNGMIEAFVTGGTPPFEYAWSNGETTATITDLSAGVYNVTVTDAGACEYIDSVEMLWLSIENQANEQVKVYPNPFNDVLFIESNINDLSINVINTLGAVVLLKNSASNTTEIDMSDLPAGLYFVEINLPSQKIVRKIIKN